MIAVIGCGNANRSDDGAGPAVVRALRERGLASAPFLKLLDAGTDGMGVIYAARGCRSLVIIDACQTGAEPGAIFEVPGEVLQREPERSFTLHDFRWDHALHAGRRTYGAGFPADVVVLLIEARTVALGLELSPPVAAAVRQVADRVAGLVAERTLDRSGTLSTVRVRRGVLHLSRQVYEAFLPGVGAVVLLREGSDLLVLPILQAAAGGYVVKLRNAAGDRAVDAADFLRDQGLEDQVELEAPVAWVAERACLRAADVFPGMRT